MPKEKIYISLPINGNKDYKLQAQIASIKLKARGCAPVNPVLLSGSVSKKNPAANEIDYLLNDLKVLSKCDGIFLCKGFSNSLGCLAELQFAFFLKRSKPNFKIETEEYLWITKPQPTQICERSV